MKKLLFLALTGDILFSGILLAISVVIGAYIGMARELWVCLFISLLWVTIYSFMIRYSEHRKSTINQIAIVIISIVLIGSFIMFLVQSVDDSRFLPILIVNKAPVVAILVRFIFGNKIEVRIK